MGAKGVTFDRYAIARFRNTNIILIDRKKTVFGSVQDHMLEKAVQELLWD